MNALIEVKNLKRIVTSHSLDNVFDYCPRKFEFLTFYDKRPKRESGYAADVGTALHEGMQAWLISREEGDDEKTRTRKAFMAFCLHFPFDREDEQKTKQRSFSNCCLMLYKMIRSPEWDAWQLLHVEGKGWAVEVPFLLTHSSLGPMYVKDRNEYCVLCTQGKIDLIMQHRKTGMIKSVDIKTTVMGLDLIRSNYTFSGQQTGYSQIVHRMAGLMPVDFEVEYVVCMFGSVDEEPRIEFVTIEKSADEIDDYWLDKMDRLERIKFYAEQGRFPRTNGGCNSWGKECSMFDVCHSRDASFVNRWFDDMDGAPQQGYDYWVELEV